MGEIKEKHPVFITLSSEALYEFPDNEQAQKFCQARADGETFALGIDQEELDKLPEISQPFIKEFAGMQRPVTPQHFGGEFRGRAWNMGHSNLTKRDWIEMRDFLKYA